MLHVGEDAQAASRHRTDRALVCFALQLVFAVAQQHEVQLQQPLQEVDGLADLLRRVPDGARTGQLDHVPDAFLHRLEVADHQPHVVQDLAHPSLQVGAFRIGQQPVDLEMHHRFAVARVASGHHPLDRAVLVPDRADHRVQEPGHRQVAREELFRDRVDQER